MGVRVSLFFVIQSKSLNLFEELLFAFSEVVFELLMVSAVIQFVLVKIGLSLNDSPNGLFYFCEVGFVHALKVFSKPPVADHLV